MPTITQQARDGVVRDFKAEYDNGNSGAAKTVDWNNGQKQKVTLTDNCTFSFTAPPGAGNFVLKLIQDGTGGRTATWPGTMKWPGGIPPNLTSAANAVDLVNIYFDGTNYNSVFSGDFK